MNCHTLACLLLISITLFPECENCNEPSLSVVFKIKLADSWTAKEVQERIDKYHRELKSKPVANGFPRQAVTVVSEDMQGATF